MFKKLKIKVLILVKTLDEELKQAILVIKNYVDDFIDNVGFDEKMRKLNYFSNKANYVESVKKLSYNLSHKPTKWSTKGGIISVEGSTKDVIKEYDILHNSKTLMKMNHKNI